jgi:hypothetical protein
MSGSGSMSAREHGITEQSVSVLLEEALSSFPEPPPLARLRGFACGKVDFPMGACYQGSDFP